MPALPLSPRSHHRARTRHGVSRRRPLRLAVFVAAVTAVGFLVPTVPVEVAMASGNAAVATIPLGIGTVSSVTVNPVTNTAFYGNASALVSLNGQTNVPTTQTVSYPDGGQIDGGMIQADPVNNKVYIYSPAKYNNYTFDPTGPSVAMGYNINRPLSGFAIDQVNNEIWGSASTGDETFISSQGLAAGSAEQSYQIPNTDISRGGADTWSGATMGAPGNFYLLSSSGMVVRYQRGTGAIGSFSAGEGATAFAVNSVTSDVFVPATTDGYVAIWAGGGQSFSVVTGANPASPIVDSVRNKVYISTDSGIQVIDGATHSVATVTSATGKVAYGVPVAVDLATGQLYWQSTQGASLGSIDLTAPAATALSDTVVAVGGTAVSSWSVNSTTNKLYGYAGSSAVVVDLSIITTAPVTTGTAATSLAVNSVTNTTYIVHGKAADSMSVINGATQTVSTIALGIDNPIKVVVDQNSNTVWALNAAGKVVEIDGATKTLTATLTLPTATYVDMDANPATNKLYVVGGMSLITINGLDQSTVTTPLSKTLTSVAVNSTTNDIFVIGSDNTIMTVDGTDLTTKVLNLGSGGLGHTIQMLVNETQNFVYLLPLGGNTVVLFDPSTNEMGNLDVPESAGDFSGMVYVPTTQTFYISSSTRSAVVILPPSLGQLREQAVAGPTPVVATVGLSPIAMNPLTGRVYLSTGTAAMAIIDSTTNVITASPAVASAGLAVNSSTGTVYSVGYPVASNSVTTLIGNSRATGGVTSTVTPLTNNSTTSATPSLTVNASSPSTVSGAWFQVDSTVGVWTKATSTAGAGTGTQTFSTGALPSLAIGVHTVYVMGADSQQGSGVTGYAPFQAMSLLAQSPSIGQVSSYQFRVVGIAPTFVTSAPTTHATRGVPYPSYTYSASGSPAPTFTVTTGVLPTGLSLNTVSGVLSGTPTVNGSFPFTVTATNSTDPAAVAASVSIIISDAGLFAAVSSVEFGQVKQSATTQTSTGILQLTAGDSSGANQGWSVTVTSSAWEYSGNNGGLSIPAADLLLVSAGAVSRISGQAIAVSGTDAAATGPQVGLTGGVSGTLDSARKVIRAGANYGAGWYAQPLNLSLTVPAGSPIGLYTSTITVTVSTGP